MPPYAKTLWVREPYLQQILSGAKTVEVRVGYPNILRLQVGDLLLLNDLHPYRVRRIARYEGFEALLEHEDLAAIAPGSTREALLESARLIYPPEKEALGVVALELEPVHLASAACFP